MSSCPRCRTEYEDSVNWCSDCSLPTVDSLRQEAPPVSNVHVEEVEVATFGSEIEGQIWADILRQEGIPSVLIPLGPGVGGWGSAAGLPHALRVPSPLADRARELIEAEPDLEQWSNA